LAFLYRNGSNYDYGATLIEARHLDVTELMPDSLIRLTWQLNAEDSGHLDGGDILMPKMSY